MPNNNIAVGDRDTAIRTMIAEASSEGEHGLLAVGAVAVNRARQTGMSLSEVFTQRGQFEPHMNEAGRQRMARQRPGSTIWRQAEAALDRALGGEDPTNGADHFFSPRAQAAAGRDRPAWARSGATTIGNHEFFRLGYRNRSRRFYGPVGSSASDDPNMPAAPAQPARTSADILTGGAGSRGLSGDDILSGATPAPVVKAPQRAAGAVFADVLTAQTAGPDNRAENIGAARAEVENSFLANAARDSWSAKFDNPMDRLANSVYLNSVTGEAARAIQNAIAGNEPGKFDEGFDYRAHMDELEQGLGVREVDRMRTEARNYDHALQIRADIEDRRVRQEVVGDSLLYNIAGGIIDPPGAFIGIGVGKALQLGGLGARMLAMQGSRAAMTGSLLVEGAVGNVLATGAMDALGMYATPNDYIAAGMFGAGMGAISVPFVSRAYAGEARVQAVLDDVTTRAAADETRVLAEAAVRAGPNAEPQAVAAAAEQIHAEEAASPIINTHNPIPRDNQILIEDHVIAPERIDAINALSEGQADDTQRGIVNIMADRLTEIDARNPHREASDRGEAAWLRTGMASTGLIMLRSNSPRMRGIAKVISEGASGHNGRQHSVALEVVMRDTEFNRTILPWDSNFDVWRRANGHSIWKRTFGDGSVDREFNALVSAEVRGRGRPDLYTPSSDPTIIRAADMVADFYKKAGEEQVRWKTVGSEAIKPGDVSYFPQVLSAESIKRLSTQAPERLNAYRDIIAEQARTIFGWDKKFADYFGRRYIKTAQDRANGGYDAPANLTHHQAGDFVQDLLTNMRQGADKEQLILIDKAEAKFARGGASYTKGRLDFDVMHGYKQADGSTLRLLDIMEQDQLMLMRKYGRRAAGEIALTKAGIPGKHGVDMLRATVAQDVDKGLATVQELQAFDQLMSEVLNVPLGVQGTASRAMENTRLITSAIKLGGMGLTQFAESGNGFATVGVARTLASVQAIPRLLKEVQDVKTGKLVNNPILSSFEKTQGYEFGITDYVNDRAFDVRDNEIQLYSTENLGIVSKAARGLSHLNAVYSGQRIITAVQTRGMAEQIIRRAIMDVKSGVANTKALEDMGFTPELQEALHRNMDRIATFKGSKLVSVDIRAGGLTPPQVAQIVGSVNRGASQIIQRTYPGEVGKWAHSDFLKLLFQFRTFSLTAVEKQWGRNIKTHGHVRAFMTLAGTMGFAAPIHIARVNARTVGMSEQEREEYLEKNLNPVAITQATLNYASASGLLGDVWDIGGGMVSGLAAGVGVETPEWLEGTINPRGTGTNTQLLGGKIAPSVGVVQDAFTVANGKWDRIRSLLPGQAHPALVPMLNVAETALTPEEER